MNHPSYNYFLRYDSCSTQVVKFVRPCPLSSWARRQLAAAVRVFHSGSCRLIWTPKSIIPSSMLSFRQIIISHCDVLKYLFIVYQMRADFPPHEASFTNGRTHIWWFFSSWPPSCTTFADRPLFSVALRRISWPAIGSLMDGELPTHRGSYSTQLLTTANLMNTS